MEYINLCIVYIVLIYFTLRKLNLQKTRYTEIPAEFPEFLSPKTKNTLLKFLVFEVLKEQKHFSCSLTFQKHGAKIF
jgi:hypothetical protein